MKHPIDRREFLNLAGSGRVVFASGLGAARRHHDGRGQG